MCYLPRADSAIVRTRVLTLTVVSLAAVAFGGSPGTRVYRDAKFGFVAAYPKSWGAARYDYFSRVSVEGVAFGNVPHLKLYAHYPPPALPATGVVVLVQHTTGGPPPFFRVSGHDSKLPLTRGRFRPGSPPLSVNTLFVGNGWSIGVGILFGARVSRSDRDAAWKLAFSIRMRALRSGETTGDVSYLVAGRAASYRVGSVTKVGKAFLVSAPHGFYALAELTPDCELAFTRPVAFSCPDGRQWDRMGRPLWSGASPSDALLFAPTDVAHDGHVLVAKTAPGGREHG